MAKVKKATKNGKARVTCFHCGTTRDLASATTNRCPQCGWITETYFDRNEANQVAKIYNQYDPPIANKAGVRRLLGIKGYSVSFPDQRRLADVAEQLLDVGPV